MLDLHCHILPCVDDGASSLDEALGMARICAQDGITHIAATPHCHRYIRLLRADVLPRVAQLNDQLARADIAVTILPGAEIQLTNTDEYRRDFELYCHLGDGRAFTLLEFPWNEDLYPADAPELIHWLKERGMTAIVAHPERQRHLGRNHARLRELVEAGAWLQLTVDSLFGNHGPAAQSYAVELLRIFPEMVLATDAHNLKRCSGLTAGYTWVSEHLGASCAANLRARQGEVLDALLPD